MLSLLLALPPDVTGGGDGGGGSGGFNPLLFLLPVLVIFMLMPLFNKKEKRRRNRLSELKKHDKIVTTGGIFATVVSLDEAFATVEIAKDVRVRLKRSSIFDMETPPDAKAKAKAATEQPAGKKKAGVKN